MKSANHFLRLLAIVSLAAGLLALVGRHASADDLATIEHRGTLIVGVKVDYPPFGFRSPSGEIIGIEPDLAADVAKALGVKLELVPVDAANRIELLQEGKVDLLIATLNGNIGRRSAVAILQPFYYAAGYNVMVLKSMHLTSWTQLKGKQVCGIQGAYYNYEAAMNFELHITPYAITTDALKALQDGSCMGFLYDDVAIEGELQQPEWRDYDMPLKSQEVQPWGIAVRHGQPAWSGYLSATVKRWTKDGTILSLESKYHVKHSKFVVDAHRNAVASPGH